MDSLRVECVASPDADWLELKLTIGEASRLKEVLRGYAQSHPGTQGGFEHCV